ncbi:MAG TPA: tRNA-dihydrouridine synthase [Candidatus Paceibacterota bacterium]|nr:tRNA-dihydrouridine synthase [Candidatus Paceibacterota bacterium]
METFWKGLRKPIIALAPMADVTDPAYRRLISECAAADVMWTEFVSADGLYYTREKKGIPDEENPLMRDLAFTQGEHPIVAQLFSAKPDMIRYAAKLAAERGFDGVDINMGCPDASIEKQGAGAAMMKTPELVKDIVDAARMGVCDAGRPHMGVSVKTRIGYNSEAIDTWIPAVLAARPDALTVHLRTRKEMSKVDAHWELMPRVVMLRDQLAPEVVLLGNGDVKDRADALMKIAESGADGAMIGRGIFGNPWVFMGRTDVTENERLDALVTLAHYFEAMKPGKSFYILKKHVKAFVTGFDNAAELRAKLMEATSASQMEEIVARESGF